MSCISRRRSMCKCCIPISKSLHNISANIFTMCNAIHSHREDEFDQKTRINDTTSVNKCRNNYQYYCNKNTLTAFYSNNNYGKYNKLCQSNILLCQRRCRSFCFYMNLDEPDDTRRYVQEEIKKLEQNYKTDTTAYLHCLLNLSLSYYQAEDYIKAYHFATEVHARAFEHNKQSALLYFTAITCARCASALANQYETHLMEYEEKRITISEALAAPPSVIYSAQRTIDKLRQNATRYDGIAMRVYNRPDMAFMRGWGYANVHYNKSTAEQNKSTFYESTTDSAHPSNNTNNDVRNNIKEKEWHDVRCCWMEQSCSTRVDENYQAPFNNTWKERRKKPEHASVREYYKKQQENNMNGSYPVPK